MFEVLLSFPRTQTNPEKWVKRENQKRKWEWGNGVGERESEREGTHRSGEAIWSVG